MIQTLAELQTVLAETSLAGREALALPILDTGEAAFVLKTGVASYLEDWRILRELVLRTGRWPVVVAFPGAYIGNWRKGMLKADFFSRWGFQGELGGTEGDDLSPNKFISAAENLDPLIRLQEFSALGVLNAAEFTETYCLEETVSNFGIAPDPAEIEALIECGTLKTYDDVQKWLFEWELRRFGVERATIAPNNSYFDWLEPSDENIGLLLLPTTEGWNVLAYYHWYGSEGIGTEVVIALLRSWHERYGAELVCHHGTDLQFVVSRKPTDPMDAFQLAWEQQTVAESTTILPGISLRDHARTLVHVDRWLLFEKP